MPGSAKAAERRSNSPLVRRTRNILRNAFTNPYNVVVIIAIIALTYFILVPLFEMVKTTFTMAKIDARRVPGRRKGTSPSM